MNHGLQIQMEPWISTSTGTKFYFENPTVDMIHIEDIAHSLAMTCRFNGHCRLFYSTAQHSLLVASGVYAHLAENRGSRFTDAEIKIVRTALLHDAAEAYIGDMVAPLKWVMPAFKEVEKRIEAVIWEKFDLDHHCADLIKYHDLRALATEARDLLTDGGKDWECIEGIDPYPEKIDPDHIAGCYQSFMKMFGVYSA